MSLFGIDDGSDVFGDYRYGDSVGSAGGDVTQDLMGAVYGPYSQPPTGGYNPWSQIIDVPRGKEHLYAQMGPPSHAFVPPPGVMHPDGTHEVEVVFKKGKKVIRKIKQDPKADRTITRDEAIENPKEMYLFLKQYNKKEDEKWEAAELAAYDDGKAE